MFLLLLIDIQSKLTASIAKMFFLGFIIVTAAAEDGIPENVNQNHFEMYPDCGTIGRPDYQKDWVNINRATIPSW